MPNPSPLPWRWADDWQKIDASRAGSMYWDDGENEAIEKYMDLQLLDANGNPVIPVRVDHHDVIWDGDPLTPQNRALIVRAVNAHSALVEELKKWSRTHGNVCTCALCEDTHNILTHAEGGGK